MTKKLLTVIFSCLALTAVAGNPNSGGSSTVPLEQTKPKYDPTGRPKAPSRQNVTCTYCAGTLSFSFAIPEGECVLSVTDLHGANSGVYVFDSTSGTAAVSVSPLEEAALEITTSKGNDYEGLLE